MKTANMANFVDSADPAPEKQSMPIKDRLERELTKEPGMTIRAINVFGSFYRVNWWVPMSIIGTNDNKQGKIVKSQFIRVEIGPDNTLVIT